MSTTVAPIRAKVTRAEQHIEDFGLRARAFYDNKPYVIRFQEYPATRQRIYYLASVQDVPLNVASIAADALQNLRAPLDHIAYQLERKGCGGAKPRQKVYFPIADSAAEYKPLRDRYIKRAGQAAIEAIDATEPYRDGKGHALWQLHALNKPDKHHLQLEAGAYFRSVDMGSVLRRTLRATPGWPGPADFPGGLFIRPQDVHLPLKLGDPLMSESMDLEVDENLEFRFDISFNEPGIIEPEPVLETLQNMANLIGALIDVFEPLLP